MLLLNHGRGHRLKIELRGWNKTYILKTKSGDVEVAAFCFLVDD